jgi:transposase-like protein
MRPSQRPRRRGEIDNTSGWFVDEPYVRVNGVWRYVYRAVDQYGQVIDVLVSARRFFRRALSALKVTPREVVTDAAAVYPQGAGRGHPSGRPDSRSKAISREREMAFFVPVQQRSSVEALALGLSYP